ncbi:LSM domain [Carpediemonas membranifera]|uniref:Small nuclear ribonucleoprotein Sm D2 n=1 Tax=Carpediemonas membranifera TaxID=201153 RepID=A0A8J6E083_9EUKA|nr:LSM domain [Carpediemonas membranifera]|eukprot:KAG9391436.1 LSM domain [Carpediemonas membranifera]
MYVLLHSAERSETNLTRMDSGHSERSHEGKPDSSTLGPFQILSTAVQENQKVLVSCRNDHKLYCTVKAFDRHFNLIVENAKEIWSVRMPGGKVSNQERSVNKMFIRGDSVISVVRPTNS